MPEQEKSTFLERIIMMIIRQSLGGVVKTIERFIKRTLRIAAMVLAGVVIAVLGVAFLAVGAVKWLSNIMPNSVAWAFVGIVLLLVGLLLAVPAVVVSRG